MKLFLIASVLLLPVASMAQSGSCSYWDTIPSGAQMLHEDFDTQNHTTPQGEHYQDAWNDGTCRYTCPNGSNYCQPLTMCIATINVWDTPTSADVGNDITPIRYQHVIGKNTASNSNSNLGGVSSESSAGTGVASCYLGECSVNVKISVAGLIDVSVTGNGGDLMNFVNKYTGYCQAQRAYPQTPIIIDTMNEGFQLTNAAGGVTTEIVDPGHTIHAAWTQPTSHNGFLYLDGHLFGNSTPQQPSDGCPDPATGCGNGFEALALYDSNGDGVIDASDSVFSALRVWIDSNHDGVVQPGELSALPSDGRIFLHYSLDKKTDANGNEFRYRGHWQAKGVDHTIYDVLLSLAE